MNPGSDGANTSVLARRATPLRHHHRQMNDGTVRRIDQSENRVIEVKGKKPTWRLAAMSAPGAKVLAKPAAAVAGDHAQQASNYRLLGLSLR
jgi:hypothetical protein